MAGSESCDPTMHKSRDHRALRVLIAASGTGGHLIPALHIARALKDANSQAVVEFIGSGKPLEERLIVGAGYARHVIAAAGFDRKQPFRGMLRVAACVPKGFMQVRALFESFKPDVVVGVGGYASVFPVVYARLRGIPSWIHEAERHPGLANRFLGYFADQISLAFAETGVRGRAKPHFTGHPVRVDLKQIDRDTIRIDAPRRVLVMGGSQGARGIDQAILSLVDLLSERNIEVFHQCRQEGVEVIAESYRTANVSARVVPFIDDMVGAYEWADLIISRAGAGSVAEISCVNRPAILVPYPHQQGTHQTDNAMTLVNRGKAVLVEEKGPDFNSMLRRALEALLEPDTYRRMKEAHYEPRGLEAAAAIAQGIISIARRGA